MTCASARAASACSASPRAAFDSSRPEAIRCLASLSAEMCAALRLLSRSAAECSSRAASPDRCAWRQCSRACVSPPRLRRARLRRRPERGAWLRLHCGRRQARFRSPAGARVRPGAAPRRSARGPLPRNRPSAKDRLRSDTSRWPGLSVFDEAWDRRRATTTPICARRRRQFGWSVDVLRQSGVMPAGSAGSAGSRAAPPQCIGADAPLARRDRHPKRRQAPSHSLRRP